MLVLLISHITVTTCCLCGGILFYKLFTQENGSRSLVFYLISGLVLFTGLTQIAILFVPAGWQLRFLLLIFLLLSVFYTRKELRSAAQKIIEELKVWSLSSIVLFLICWLMILLINAGPTMMDDTDSYHIQSIKWIREFGSVPGLANLHERFGFNSSWFSSIALFSFSSNAVSGYTLLNGVLSVWLVYWLISKYNLLNREHKWQACFGILATLIVCLIVWPLLRGNSATSNYDFITTVVVLILFIEIFLSPGKNISPSSEWIIWPAYLLTVRIVNFPLLLLSLVAFIVFIKQKKIKFVFGLIACCVLLIFPFIVRNIVISGYPLYPLACLDWTNVDWKPEPQTMEKLIEYIKYYNRVSTTYANLEQTKALGSAWMAVWFKHLFFFDKMLLISGMAGILLTIARSFIVRTKYSSKILLLLLISFFWLTSWFLISPDPRFVYGNILFGIFLLAYHIAGTTKNIEHIKLLTTTVLPVLIAGAGFYLVSKPIKQPAYRNWSLPAQLPQPAIKEIVLDGIVFRVPDKINDNWNARCYGSDLPCLYKMHPKLKARGKNIRSGFRLEK